jgi:hypothetical protein
MIFQSPGLEESIPQVSPVKPIYNVSINKNVISALVTPQTSNVASRLPTSQKTLKEAGE